MFLGGASVHQLMARKPLLRVLEVGFGTGLNFLLTAAAVHAAGTALEYAGLEQALPTYDDLKSLRYADLNALTDAAEALLAWRQEIPSIVPVGYYARELLPCCTLRLHIGDATTLKLQPGHFDAIYLDAFSPRKNPALWTPAFLTRLFEATAPGGRLATYSAAGHVRRALAQAGYRIVRRAGPPGKREVLSAARPAA